MSQPSCLGNTRTLELISAIELVIRLSGRWAVVGKGYGTAFCSVKKDGQEFEVHIREI